MSTKLSSISLSSRKIECLKAYQKHRNFEKAAKELGVSKQYIYMVYGNYLDHREEYEKIAEDFLGLDLR